MLTLCHIVTYDFLYFSDSCKQNISNATLGTSIVFQVSVLERLENINFSKKNPCFGPT